MTCFEIAHHEIAKGLWNLNLSHKQVLNDRSPLKKHETNKKQKMKTIPRTYNVNTSHGLYLYLRQCYNMNPVSRVSGEDGQNQNRKKTNVGNSEFEDE